ncbi:MAG: peptidoglycan DL-endopeptidase CwlO [Pseudonocardiales bacterium]|nr:peptidoglycan DL-endopeptidase CwlO [Pseudonocardiales bacterium]
MQAGNARTIVAVTQRETRSDPTSTRDAAIIALITAYQESTLHNLSEPNGPGSAGDPNAQGSRTDHDSIGLFQQRSSWGTVAQRIEPGMGNDHFPRSSTRHARLEKPPPRGRRPVCAGLSLSRSLPDMGARCRTMACLDHQCPRWSERPTCNVLGRG